MRAPCRPVMTWMLLLAAAAPSSCASAAVRAARGDGAAAARAELADGRPSIWAIGRLPPGVAPDAETGLPVVGFTCDAGAESSAARDAHNEVIRRAWREGRIGARDR